MESLNLPEVFSALNSRVFAFESHSFNDLLLLDSSEKIKYKDFDYKAIIKDLYLKVGMLDDLLVFKEVDVYKKRIFQTLDVDVPLIIADINKAKRIKHDPKGLKELRTSFQNELDYYIFQLIQIQTSKKKAFELDFKKRNPVKLKVNENSKPAIELPDFTLKTVTSKKHDPKLSNREAAYLLYYFRELGITPAYTPESIKKLAEVVFGRNGKNVSTPYSNIGQVKEYNVLAELKIRLEEVIKKIDMDLRTSNK